MRQKKEKEKEILRGKHLRPVIEVGMNSEESSDDTNYVPIINNTADSFLKNILDMIDSNELKINNKNDYTTNIKKYERNRKEQTVRASSNNTISEYDIYNDDKEWKCKCRIKKLPSVNNLQKCKQYYYQAIRGRSIDMKKRGTEEIIVNATNKIANSFNLELNSEELIRSKNKGKKNKIIRNFFKHNNLTHYPEELGYAINEQNVTTEKLKDSTTYVPQQMTKEHRIESNIKDQVNSQVESNRSYLHPPGALVFKQKQEQNIFLKKENVTEKQKSLESKKIFSSDEISEMKKQKRLEDKENISLEEKNQTEKHLCFEEKKNISRNRENEKKLKQKKKKQYNTKIIIKDSAGVFKSIQNFMNSEMQYNGFNGTVNISGKKLKTPKKKRENVENSNHLISSNESRKLRKSKSSLDFTFYKKKSSEDLGEVSSSFSLNPQEKNVFHEKKEEHTRFQTKNCIRENGEEEEEAHANSRNSSITNKKKSKKLTHNKTERIKKGTSIPDEEKKKKERQTESFKEESNNEIEINPNSDASSDANSDANSDASSDANSDANSNISSASSTMHSRLISAEETGTTLNKCTQKNTTKNKMTGETSPMESNTNSAIVTNKNPNLKNATTSHTLGESKYTEELGILVDEDQYKTFINFLNSKNYNEFKRLSGNENKGNGSLSNNIRNIESHCSRENNNTKELADNTDVENCVNNENMISVEEGHENNNNMISGDIENDMSNGNFKDLQKTDLKKGILRKNEIYYKNYNVHSINSDKYRQLNSKNDMEKLTSFKSIKNGAEEEEEKEKDEGTENIYTHPTYNSTSWKSKKLNKHDKGNESIIKGTDMTDYFINYKHLNEQMKNYISEQLKYYGKNIQKHNIRMINSYIRKNYKMEFSDSLDKRSESVHSSNSSHEEIEEPSRNDKEESYTNKIGRSSSTKTDLCYGGKYIGSLVSQKQNIKKKNCYEELQKKVDDIQKIKDTYTRHREASNKTKTSRYRSNSTSNGMHLEKIMQKERNYQDFLWAYFELNRDKKVLQTLLEREKKKNNKNRLNELLQVEQQMIEFMDYFQEIFEKKNNVKNDSNIYIDSLDSNINKTNSDLHIRLLLQSLDEITKILIYHNLSDGSDNKNTDKKNSRERTNEDDTITKLKKKSCSRLLKSLKKISFISPEIMKLYKAITIVTRTNN